MKNLNLFLIISMLTFGLTSCEPDPDPIEEQELITTLVYTLTPIGGGTPVIFSFKDIDGDGGNNPVITNGVLDGSKEYAGTLAISNESVNPAENITAEINEEAEDHQFFFTPSSTLTNLLQISYGDLDINGKPIGLLTKVSTTGFGKGKLVITLRHEPNKSGTNVADGNITNAGGETDIEVSFDLEIK